MEHYNHRFRMDQWKWQRFFGFHKWCNILYQLYNSYLLTSEVLCVKSGFFFWLYLLPSSKSEPVRLFSLQTFSLTSFLIKFSSYSSRLRSLIYYYFLQINLKYNNNNNNVFCSVEANSHQNIYQY